MEPPVQTLHVIRHFAVAVIKRFSENRCTENAAALTYTTLFAVVPVMTLTYSMLSAIPSLQGVGDSVQDFIFSNFVPATGEAIQSYLHNFSQQARKLTSVGVAFLLVTSFMMLRTIDKALNQIWQVHRVRRGVSGFLLYWAILSLGPLLFGAGFLLTSYLASLKLVSDTTAMFGGEQWLLKLMPLLLSTLVFTLLYSAVPSRKVPVRHALVGAVLVAVLVELAKNGFALFITLSPSYQLVYGAFAAVPLFLLWIYLTWILVLLGAVVVRSLALFGGREAGCPLPPLISMMVVLKAFQDNFQQGRGLSFMELQYNQGELNVALDDWERHTAILSGMNLISKNEEGDSILVRDLRHIHLAEFCQQLPWALPSGEDLKLMSDCSRQAWFASLLSRLENIEKVRLEEMNCSLDELLGK